MKYGSLLSRRYLLLLFAVLFFFIVVIQASFGFGRLSSPPSYDDIWYLLDGGIRYEKLVNWGVLPFVKQLLAIPMHSPFCSAQAVISFLLFGMHEWSPYMLNLIILAIFVFYCARLINTSHHLIFWSATLFLFSLPITSWAVHEFRPDFPCALFISIGATEILLPLSTNSLKRKNLVIGISLFMFCLWIKPSFFPHTYILGILTLCIVLLYFLASKTNLSDRKFKILETLGYSVPIILASSIFFIITAGKEAIPYFFLNTNTDFAQQTWIQFTFLESLIRNSIGTSSYLIMSFGNIIVLSICIIAITINLIKKNLFSFSVTAFSLAFVSLLIVSKSGHDSHYFQMTFWTLLIFITCHSIGSLYIHKPYNIFTLSFLAAFTIVTIIFRTYYCNHNPKQYDWSSLIVEKAYQHGLKTGKTVDLFIPLVGTYNDYLLNWRSLLMRRPINCHSNIELSNLQEFRQEIKKYNAILLPGPDNNSIVDYHITTKIRDEIETEISNSSEWNYQFSAGTNRQDEWIYYTRNQ